MFVYVRGELFLVFKRKRKVMSTNQYFYDTNAQEEKTELKKRRREKPTFDQSKCWFCLASPSVEKHLVITVGETVYLALAKGNYLRYKKKQMRNFQFLLSTAVIYKVSQHNVKTLEYSNKILQAYIIIQRYLY